MTSFEETTDQTYCLVAAGSISGLVAAEMMSVMSKRLDRVSKRPVGLLGPLLLVVLVTGCLGPPSAEERVLMDRRDERRLEAIAAFETVVWSPGYVVLDTIDGRAVFPFEETYGGGISGRYGHDFLWPEGSEASDWFRDLDAAIIARGVYEGYENDLSVLRACDGGFAYRSYRHVVSGDRLVVTYSPLTGDNGSLSALAMYSAGDGNPTMDPLSRLVARPGDPCDYP